ncbi:MAG: hypothetical protein GY786_18265 [Proteobacteria bacterium]|nr:hypothetical protein [Pseudomonadota bacterium]
MPSKDIRIEDQSSEDKMYLLRLVAHQYLGEKWQYYSKIKRSGDDVNLFGATSLLELMNATKSALRFTSKAARNAYRLIYKSCLSDIRFDPETDLNKFPTLPEIKVNGLTPALTPDLDAIIIAWTPLKFLLPCRQIRDKGKATERHTEGLATKLYFKVVGYYASDENWDQGKLSFYLRQIDEDSTFQDISAALDPLKQDLLRFGESYQLFKFGQPLISNDAVNDDTAFNDAFGVENTTSQLKTLYWQEFIYRGVELFLFRYYLTLISSTNSQLAIKYLSVIFEPAMVKAIENKHTFNDSFYTDISKKEFRIPYAKFKQHQDKKALKRRLKTRNGNYITYNYTLPLLKKAKISFDIPPDTNLGSLWAYFLKENILGQQDEEVDIERFLQLDLSSEERKNLLIQIMNFVIKCNDLRVAARERFLENFKQRVKTDTEASLKKTNEIRTNAEKKIRQMEKKVRKLSRLKQGETVEVYQMDIEEFKIKVEERCQLIESQAEEEMFRQQKRLKNLFANIEGEKKQRTGRFAKNILKVVEDLDGDGEFVPDFKKFVATTIQKKYEKELEPFYREMFEILSSSPQEKVILIQSLEMSGGSNALKLELTKEDLVHQRGMIENLKTKIRGNLPDVFEHKVVFTTLTIPVEDLFRMSITNPSLMAVLRLKVMSPQNPRMRVLDNAIVRSLMVLNLVINPVPKHHIVLAGKKKDSNPLKNLNAPLFNRLIIQIQR